MPRSFIWKENWSSSHPFTPESITIFSNTSDSSCISIINLDVNDWILCTWDYICRITFIFVRLGSNIQSIICVIDSNFGLIEISFSECTFTKIKVEWSDNTIETSVPWVLLKEEWENSRNEMFSTIIVVTCFSYLEFSISKGSLKLSTVSKVNIGPEFKIITVINVLRCVYINIVFCSGSLVCCEMIEAITLPDCKCPITSFGCIFNSCWGSFSKTSY